MSTTRKILGGLLALYMLALVVLPCRDTCGTCEIQNQQTPAAIHTAQDHHGEESDRCSPFCSCSCCSTLMAIVHPPEIKTFVQTFAADFLVIKQSFVSAFANDCWQPPRAT